MWHAWGVGEVQIWFWQGDLRERNHWENLGVRWDNHIKKDIKKV